MNMHLAAYFRRLKNQRKSGGGKTIVTKLVLVVVATGLIVPLFGPVFLAFIGGPDELVARGVENILTRFGVCLIGLLSIDLYSVLIRGEDRDILSLYPVNPVEVVKYAMVRVVVERIIVLLVCLFLLSPVAQSEGAFLYGLMAVALTGLFAVGVTFSAMMHLLAVTAARSESMAGLLDMVRGNNPRVQAAFLYAPGLVLIVSAALIFASTAGVTAVWHGEMSGYLLLASPYVLAALAVPLISKLAQSSWFPASLLVAEIDARYAMLVEEDDQRRVYLDWAVRFFPRRIGVHLLRDLRAGWRGRRIWITGAWLAGIGAALAGWLSSDTAPLNAAGIGVVSVWIVAAVGVLIESNEPYFLHRWLPRTGVNGLIARFVALICWGQAVLIPAVFSVWVRHGTAAAFELVVTVEVVLLVCSVTAIGCGLLYRRGLLVYVPVASVGAMLSLSMVMR